MANRRGLDTRAAFGGSDGGFGVQQFSAPGAGHSLGAGGGGFGAFGGGRSRFGPGGLGAALGDDEPARAPLQRGVREPPREPHPGAPQSLADTMDPSPSGAPVQAHAPGQKDEESPQPAPAQPALQSYTAAPARKPIPAPAPSPAPAPAPFQAPAPAFASGGAQGGKTAEREEEEEEDHAARTGVFSPSGGQSRAGEHRAVPTATAAAAAGAGGGEPQAAAAAGISPPAVIGIKVLDFTNMRHFLTSPVPYEAGCVQCYIERDKKGLNKRMFPVYSLYMREGDRFLLASRKRARQKTSNYLVSMSSTDMDRDGPNYLGKLRSNFVGTEFTMFDDGAGPGDGKGKSRLRQELGVVMYTSNIMSSRGPRKMKVAVPKVDLATGKATVFCPTKEDDSMAEMYRNGYTQDMVQLINKPPKWNEGVGAYVLNFNGRVTMASVKNFQLVTPEDHERVVLQFGRVGKDLFTMDMMWPLTPLQAFQACLSSFDSKLACE